MPRWGLWVETGVGRLAERKELMETAAEGRRVMAGLMLCQRERESGGLLAASERVSFLAGEMADYGRWK